MDTRTGKEGQMNSKYLKIGQTILTPMRHL